MIVRIDVGKCFLSRVPEVVSESGCDLATKRSPEVDRIIYVVPYWCETVRYVIWSVGMHNLEYQDSGQKHNFLCNTQPFKFESMPAICVLGRHSKMIRMLLFWIFSSSPMLVSLVCSPNSTTVAEVLTNHGVEHYNPSLNGWKRCSIFIAYVVSLYVKI